MSDRQSRRRFLGASGAVALTTIAGCLGGDEDSAGGNGDEGGMENGDEETANGEENGDEETADGEENGNEETANGEENGNEETANGEENGDEETANGEEDVPMVAEVPTAIDDYLQDAPNYDGGMVDATGQDQVTIALTAESVFEPPAVRVDSGTTIQWLWEGGAHNVVSDAASAAEFKSGSVVVEEGETFEQSFDDGIQLYYCEPHVDLGMLGAVDVVAPDQ